MLQVSFLLNAVRDRVCLWEFLDIFTVEKEAKKFAAKCYTGPATGAVVKKTKQGSYIVLQWKHRKGA